MAARKHCRARAALAAPCVSALCETEVVRRRTPLTRPIRSPEKLRTVTLRPEGTTGRATCNNYGTCRSGSPSCQIKFHPADTASPRVRIVLLQRAAPSRVLLRSVLRFSRRVWFAHIVQSKKSLHAQKITLQGLSSCLNKRIFGLNRLYSPVQGNQKGSTAIKMLSSPKMCAAQLLS